MGLWFGPNGAFEAFVNEASGCESEGSAPSPMSSLGAWASDDPTLVTIEFDSECYPLSGGSVTMPGPTQATLERGSADRLTGPDGEVFFPVGGTLLGVWHRNSAGVHEVMFCEARGEVVTCEVNYGLGSVDGPANRGRFEGAGVDECPSFDQSLCEDAASIARGVATVTTADGEPIGLTIDQLMILRSDGSMALEWMDRTGGGGPTDLPFHCPWYRSWASALVSPDNCTRP